jgi:hypothetical protein
VRSSPPGLNKVARSQPRWTQHGNTWTAARARISSFVMKAAAAADFAEVVAAAHAAIKAQADDCRRLSIGVVSSGIACATWMAYGHSCVWLRTVTGLGTSSYICMCATSSTSSLSRNAAWREAWREACAQRR